MTTTTTKTEITVGQNPVGEPVMIDPMLGSGIVTGATKTGKTTFLRHVASGASTAGAQVHVFDSKGMGYTGIDTTTTCVGNSAEALNTAADVLTTVCDTMETRHEKLNQTACLRSDEQPILIVVDEYQLWSNSTLNHVFDHLVTRLLRVGRSAGITLWTATSQPECHTGPTAITRNVVYRTEFNQTSQKPNNPTPNNNPYTARITNPTKGPVLTHINP